MLMTEGSFSAKHFGSQIIATFYCLFIAWHPIAVVRPSKYSTYFGLNACLGFQTSTDEDGYIVGLVCSRTIVFGDLKVSSLFWPLFVYFYGMAMRIVELSLGSAVYYHMNND